jgi:transmembrane sensor
LEDQAHIRNLFSKYLEGNCSAEEIDELLDYFGSSEKKTGLNDLILDALQSEEMDERSSAVAQDIVASVDVSLLKEVRLREGSYIGTRKLWSRIAVAAVTVLSLGLGLYFYANRVKVDKDTLIASNDIAPGSVGATLTLANGKKIVLSGAQNGELAKEAGVVISKSADGQLLYVISSERSDERSISINTLSTAIGETYSVVLGDGTKVWMNAGSVLKYSSGLAWMPKRTVELTGEAYFEVAKDKSRPFIVSSGSQAVEVLGTHFNINTYDGKGVATTLLEGSVRVSSGGVVKVIRPGEQAVSYGGGINVAQVEAEDIVAWKEGYFMFDSEPLEIIMGKLSRWYGVKVEFAEPSLKQRTFLGSMSKYVNISQVLTKFNAAGKTEFVLIGDKVVVSAKKYN